LFTLQVDFALSLRDDFNGIRIKDDNCTFAINGQVFKPMRKPDGFYVFCGLGIDKIFLQVNHFHYHEYHEVFTLGSVDDASYRIKEVRLCRKYSAMHKNCEWYEVTGHHLPANSEVLAFARMEDHSGNDIIVDVDAESIRVMNSTSSPVSSLVGRRFTINLEDASTFFVTHKAPDMYKYYIKGGIPPPSEFQVLYAVYRSIIESDGTLFIPHITTESIFKFMYKERESDKWHSVSVVKGD